jgi:soluble lytic murein transglycosylase
MRRHWACTRIPPQFRTGSVNIYAGRVACSRAPIPAAAILSFSILAAPGIFAQVLPKPVKKPAAKSAARASRKPAASPASRIADATERQLAQLSRALRDNGNATTYGALSAFAKQNAKNDYGARAALALGYYDLSRDKPDLALAWLRKSVGDKLMRPYVQYWQAQTSLALGQKQEGIEQLWSFLRDFPGSVMTEQAVTSLAGAALSSGRGEEALSALESFPETNSRPAMLLLRAQAHEKMAAAKGEKPVTAAADYIDLYYRFPLNEEGKAAGQRIPSMQFALGETFPGTPMQTQIARAETFFLAKRWSEARAEYAGLLPKLSGRDHDRAQLRIAVCEVQQGGKLEPLNKLSLTDPDLDAERIYAISQAHRSQKLESQMLDDVDQLASRFPGSSWAGDGLFSTGNYYWVVMDRSRAANFYRRTLETDPNGKNSQPAAWRLAWTAYMERKPEAADMIEDYVRRFPMSSYVQDALYWLGRSYERSGNPERARSYFLAAATRFPLTYFGAKAAARIRPAPDGIGSTPVSPVEVLSAIPPAPSLPHLDPTLSESLLERQARAVVLSDIAFDASAELEYRAVYAATHSPKYLVDAGEAAVAAGHYAAGMAAVRQAFPQLEARRVAEIPNEAWRTAFPLPYESNVRSEAARNQLDPMLVAGLVRQESAFESNAMSRVGAVGLMQVMPKTALKLARELKVRYARARLTDPGYNLQLGSRYLANLIQGFGTPEAALAAYNAGEDRVGQWTAGQNYLEPAEFVESIPFTETREYVQIVIRNADVYRQVYGPTPQEAKRPGAPPASRAAHGDAIRTAKAQGSGPAQVPAHP